MDYSAHWFELLRQDCEKLVEYLKEKPELLKYLFDFEPGLRVKDCILRQSYGSSPYMNYIFQFSPYVVREVFKREYNINVSFNESTKLWEFRPIEPSPHFIKS